MTGSEIAALLAERDALKVSLSMELYRADKTKRERDTAEAALSALRDERDALKVQVTFLKVELSQLANFNPDWDMLQATRESLKEHQAALSALRARETGLREAMHAIYKGLSSEKDGEFWTAQKWCDDHDIYVDNLQGLRVLEEVARHALSTPAVHGASEAER